VVVKLKAEAASINATAEITVIRFITFYSLVW
jgi:hypothetical protein